MFIRCYDCDVLVKSSNVVWLVQDKVDDRGHPVKVPMCTTCVKELN